MMVDAKLLAENQQRLEKEKKRLEQLLSRVAKKDQAGGDYHADYPEFGNKDDENASEVEVYEANVAEGWDLEQKLRRVEAALHRIASGSYGMCEIGGEAIPVERLAAVPEAENCIEHDKKKV